MMVMRRLWIFCAAVLLAAAGCTGEEGRPAPPVERGAARGTTSVRVAAASFDVPEAWSYSVSRMVGDSWQFAFSARHPFNLGARCAPKTGALGELLEHEKAFVFGYAYRADLPKAAAPSAQTPGEFRLDPDTLAAYEGSGCTPTYRIDFEQGGYYFTVHVALDDSAAKEIEDEVMAVLNSAAARTRESG